LENLRVCWWEVGEEGKRERLKWGGGGESVYVLGYKHIYGVSCYMIVMCIWWYQYVLLPHLWLHTAFHL
jgi:hypothetical protein